MSLTRKQLALVAVGALWATMSASPAMADDTELFVGMPSASSTTRPNILFIIDDSISMGTLVQTQATYDPSVTYSGSCSTSRIYWRSGTGSPPSYSVTPYPLM